LQRFQVGWDWKGTWYPPCGVEVYECEEEEGRRCLGGGGTKAARRE
jgi:hypothetical protein